MHSRHWTRPCRTAVALLVLVLVWMALRFTPALAQTPVPTDLAGAAQAASSNLIAATNGQTLPTIWYLLAAGLAMLVPAGFVLLAVANLEQSRAWNTALGGLAAAGLAAFAYWAVGFALHFGGVGLVYPQPELHGLVLEWSPLSSEWGIGWGMAGLAGWFLSGNVTALAYALFLAHLPWVMLAALLPVMALRGRAPSTVTLILALVMGALVFPLAGNWVQGGGWLNALGRNMGLGHGFVDAGGAGTVHLVAASFALAALTVWSTRRDGSTGETQLPPAHQPLLAVVGALLMLAGSVGWLFANPLQSDTLGALGMMRGAVALTLAAAGGLIFPLLYTWFVTGSSDPTMTARGFAAGLVAGLASSPFVQPGIALLIGLLAGASVPFVTFLLDGRLRIQDRTGVVVSSGVPALIGLLLVGIFADGSVGAGWQQTGLAGYLGVPGQGVSGLTVASGFQADFPGQVQAQVIGMAALALWGFLSGLIVCVPLGLLFHSLLQRESESPSVGPAGSEGGGWSEGWNAAPQVVTPLPLRVGAPAAEPMRGYAGNPALPYAAPPAEAAAHPASRERTTTESAVVPASLVAAPTDPPVQPGADPFAAVPYAYDAPPPTYLPPAPLPTSPVLPMPDAASGNPLDSVGAPAWADRPGMHDAGGMETQTTEVVAYTPSGYVDPYSDSLAAIPEQPMESTAPFAAAYADPYADPVNTDPVYLEAPYAEPAFSESAAAIAAQGAAPAVWSEPPIAEGHADDYSAAGTREPTNGSSHAGNGSAADSAAPVARSTPLNRRRRPLGAPPPDAAEG